MVKALTIRILVAFITFTTGVAMYDLSSSIRQRTNAIQTVNTGDDRTLIFEGVVLKIGPQVPGSGVFAFYRSAKYRVDSISYGHYEKPEIVVNHLSMTTHELDGLEEGSRVCVTVERPKDKLARSYVGGLGEKNESVDVFYVALTSHSGPCYEWESYLQN